MKEIVTFVKEQLQSGGLTDASRQDLLANMVVTEVTSVVASEVASEVAAEVAAETSTPTTK
jgi:hypothetical protein